MVTHTGTDAYVAPEMIKSTVYNEKIDIWSAGCVLYTMLAGYQPFEAERYLIYLTLFLDSDAKLY